MIRIGYSAHLSHGVHQIAFHECPPIGCQYIPLHEISLYRLSQHTPQPFAKKDTDLEKFRWVYFLGGRRVDIIHNYNRLTLNHQPWVVDVEHPSRFFPQMLWLNRWKPQLISRTLSSHWCKGIMPWSDYSERVLRKAFPAGEIQKKILRIYPTTIPQRRRTSPSQVPVISFIGKTFFRKGGDLVIQSLLQLSVKFAFRLHWVGDLPQKYASLIKKLPVESYSLRTDRKSIMEKILPMTDIFVMPSKYEAFGQSFLEAMSFGCALIGSDVGAIPEFVVQARNGSCIPFPVRYHQMAEQCFEVNQGIMQNITEQEQSPIDEYESLIAKLTQAIGEFLDDRRKLGNAQQSSWELFHSKFHPDVRNKALHSIYERSLA